MQNLFDKSELMNCTNVYGRLCNQKISERMRRDALDEQRVNYIRQLVQEKFGNRERVWPECVRKMNKSINRLKAAARNNPQ